MTTVLQFELLDSL